MIPPLLVADGEFSRETARQLARRELTKPEYHRDDPSLPQRVWEWISEWLESLIDSLDYSGSGDGMSLVALAVIIAFIATAAAVIWWRVGGLRRSRSRRAALLAGGFSTAADHRSAAERYAAERRWAEAIRERLRAIARDLEERVILDPNPGRTAHELAELAARALPDHAGELRAAARLFDDVWYGEHPATEPGYRSLTDLDQRLRTARPAPIERAPAGSPG